MAADYRSPWTPAEVATLTSMAAAGTPARAIAAVLGRTVRAVEQAKHRHAVPDVKATCPECGAVFLQAPRGRPRVWCRDECKAATRARQRVDATAARRARPCPMCGGPLPARGRPRTYCESYCAKRAWALRRAGRMEN